MTSCADAYPGAFDQRTYPGAGDIDDCWVIATIWAAHASDPAVRLPTVPEFRRHAGDPDDGKTDGGSLTEVLAGSRGTWPDLLVAGMEGTWAALAGELERGRIASLAVLSARLPKEVRFGFMGWHQVGAFRCSDGGYYISNPLQRDGARPLPISAPALEYAATALGYVRAALYPPRTAQEGDPTMLLTDPQALSGTAVMVASWRLWRVRDDTATTPQPKGTRFDVLGSVRYHASARRPEGYTGYLVSLAGELHVLPSENVSTFTAEWTTREAWNRGVQEAAKRAASAVKTA